MFKAESLKNKSIRKKNPLILQNLVNHNLVLILLVFCSHVYVFFLTKMLPYYKTYILCCFLSHITGL